MAWEQQFNGKQSLFSSLIGNVRFQGWENVRFQGILSYKAQILINMQEDRAEAISLTSGVVDSTKGDPVLVSYLLNSQ